MSQQHSEKIIALFDRVQAMEPGADRDGFLAELARTDPEMRMEVESLLAAHEAAGEFLGKTRIMLVPEITGEKPGDQIGNYKLLQKIGEGGMGTVWMADQLEPVRRRVALKVVKPGMDSRQVLARFEAERQALALMDHPNIAKVLDAGTTGQGRPYFVMDLVKGVPITRFCDEQRLTIHERLELFVPVCLAIAHAHERGIIHRDISPSNVLVALYDGQPVPKIIDFGIAKAIGQPLTDRTLVTEFGAIIGKLEYMSPEQAEFNQLEIDPRSDIYSLGVLLYELLTGTTPMTRQNLRSAALDEILRLIRELEPPKPSTRLSQSREQLPSISAQRKLAPAQLSNLLRQDLDWIVMKALEKERGRRYQSCSQLAEDLVRHLRHQPVLARPPSAIYKAQKFLLRNRVPATFAVMVLILIATVSISVAQYVKQARAGKFGSITIHSSPKGAQIWHNQRLLGLTPFSFTNLEATEFSYVLILSNYETVTNITAVSAKQHINDFTFLRPLMASTTSPGADTNMTEVSAASPGGATVLLAEGRVQIAKKGTTEWLPAQTNLVLQPHDKIRTGPKSRAMLRLPNSTVIRLNQLTTVEIQPESKVGTTNAVMRVRG